MQNLHRLEMMLAGQWCKNVVNDIRDTIKTINCNVGYPILWTRTRLTSMEIYSPVTLSVHSDVLKQLILNKSCLIYRVTECCEGEGYPFPVGRVWRGAVPLPRNFFSF